MSIICGKDIIDISKVSYIAIDIIRDFDLERLEEQYHGSYYDALFGISLRDSIYRNLGYSEMTAVKSGLGSKIENVLNKYWYEIALALPLPKSQNRVRDNWTYATKKQCSFSVGYIDEAGNASVVWKFKKDFGFNAADYHVFGDGEVTLSLPDDIIPMLCRLSDKKPVIKSKSQKAGGFLSLLYELAVHPSDAMYHDDTRETPAEMQKELKNICVEYKNTFGEIRKEKENRATRIEKRKEFLNKYTGKSVLTISVGGDRKKYLEGYCGFDIFAKKQELDRELAAFKKKRAAEISASKASHIATITTDFNAQGLLSVVSLSNKGKLQEYASVREFCCKYIPSLNDHTFKVESISDDHPEHVSKEACSAFKENWIRMNRSYNALRRGASGEEKVYEVLRLYDDRIRILRDYTWGHEHDFVIITPYGISTIEVKTLRGDYELSETGVLKCLSNSRAKPKDVAFQSKKHLETLRRNLKDCSAFSSNVPLSEIICSAEGNFAIKDNYHLIPVCYYNTVDKVLLPETKEVVLSDEAMDKIEGYLLSNKQEAFKFDIFLPRGEIDGREEFIRSFAEVASGYLSAQYREDAT